MVKVRSGWQTLSIHVTDSEKAELLRVSHFKGCSMSQLVRQALVEVLSRESLNLPIASLKSPAPIDRS